MKKYLLLTFLTAGAVAFSSAPLFAQSGSPLEPIISEIMYNPPESGADSLEYIELYNPSLTIPLDLSGYYFSAGIVHTFPQGTVIAPEGFLVVAIDSVAFEGVFGVPALQWTSGGLSNGGEAIAIRNASGALADTVFYDDNASWPQEADQGGASLVLCDLASDNNGPASWGASTNAMGIIINGMELYADPYEWFACITVGISDDKVMNSSVYPNPAKDAFTMQFASMEKAAEINIFNSLGQVVYAQPVAVGTTSTTIDANLESGFYIIRLNAGDSTEAHRLIVE